jgi:hypothetical protein
MKPPHYSRLKRPPPAGTDPRLAAYERRQAYSAVAAPFECWAVSRAPSSFWQRVLFGALYPERWLVPRYPIKSPTADSQNDHEH